MLSLGRVLACIIDSTPDAGLACAPIADASPSQLDAAEAP
jgi:hypothetical protein